MGNLMLVDAYPFGDTGCACGCRDNLPEVVALISLSNIVT